MSTASAPPQPPDATSMSAPLPPAAVAPPARRRPVPITILAALQLVNAAFYGVVGASLILAPDAGDRVAEIFESAGLRSGVFSEIEGAAFAMLLLALGFYYLSTAVLLLRTRRAGWTLTMLVTGLALALQVWNWWSSGTITAVSLLINVVAVFYLNQRQVREAFGVAGGRIGSVLETRG